MHGGGPSWLRATAAWLAYCTIAFAAGNARADEPIEPGRDRSPVDLVLTADESWLLTANQTSGSVSLVETSSGRVADELPVGERPAAIAIAPDDSRAVVSCAWSGDVVVLSIADAKLAKQGAVHVGFEPRGVAISPDGRLAYAALSSGAAVAVIDLETMTEVERIDVGRWPRQLALSPDGSRLAVGASGDGGVSVVDAGARRLVFQENFVGMNLGQMHVSADGQSVYFPWVGYGANPIFPENIRRGWVLASRIGRVRLDTKTRREAIALDPRGRAVGDPHGMGLTPDQRRLVCSAAGTQELLVFRAEGLPFLDYGGPGDHIDPELLEDDSRFYRIELGGRPLNLRTSRDNRHVYVANYLLNAVQVVDLDARRVARTIPLAEASEPSLVRRGEAIFFDARRSLDQWYSCHTCHYEGDTNSITIDTNNDDTFFTFKTVLSLRNLTNTAPWTWHGWQEDLDEAMRKSLTDTMQGPEPSADDVRALVAYFEQLTPPPNPHVGPRGELDAAAQRGRELFFSERANCASCHSGPYYTDGQVHDVGTGGSNDAYDGYNTPSLVGVYNRVRLLHNGERKSIEEILAGVHRPDKVSGGEPLSKEQVKDLAAFVRTL